MNKNFFSLYRVGLEGTYLNIINVTYDKSTSNIILNRENLESMPLKSETRQGYLLSLFLNAELEELHGTVREEKKIKGPQIFKVEINLSLFADDNIILYRMTYYI